MRALSAADTTLLELHSERVPFAIGDALMQAGNPINNVCFPENGIAGVLDALEGDRRYAVG